jgi:hypothetical protein
MKVSAIASLSRISTKAIFIILMVVLVLSISATIALSYLYLNSRQTQDPDQLTEKEVQLLVNKVSKLIELPEETPTVATVTDVEKLSTQPFFQNAINGDKVLIFQTARKAYLYRPENNILIEVAPLNVQDQTEATTTSAPAAPEPAFTVALYNGTQTVGLTNTFQQKLTTTFPKAEVVSKANATTNTYETSFMVDVQGNDPELSQMLSQRLNLPLKELPADEATPSAQVLIILGNDQR